DISQKCKEGIKVLDDSKAIIDRADQASMRSVFKGIRSLSTLLNDDMEQLTAYEQDEEAKTSQAQASLTASATAILIGGVAVNVLVCVVLAVLVYRGLTKRLSVMRDNAFRLSRGESLNPRLAGADEIADLDRVFHQMADGLSEAQRKERALVENAVDVICAI